MARTARWVAAALGVVGVAVAGAAGDDTRVRVATYNIEDLRPADMGAATGEPTERARAAAAIVRELGPDILLINEFATDQPGAPGVDATAVPYQAAWRLARMMGFADGEAFVAPTNTGAASGLDLDRSGVVVTHWPELVPGGERGEAPRQMAEGRAYGGDCWGFGVFPGQYGMVLLVREPARILHERVRTFATFPWRALPGAEMPVDPATGEAWYAGEAGAWFRLSSKSHWDVPVQLANGAVVHVLASHPTPPGFDGPEGRNKHRNRDEILFWKLYVEGGEAARAIVDDRGGVGGLPEGALFVIVGDLNADPDEGNSIGDPIGTLLGSPRLGQDPKPVADEAAERLSADDTAWFGMRVDYVLPSAGIAVEATGVKRAGSLGERGWPSDHFPVWADLVVPGPTQGRDSGQP